MKKKARDINVTPLIDVLLVLLVIFMITAPMMIREIIVDLPQVVSITKSKNVIKYDNIITVSVDKNKNIFYNSEKIPLDDFIDKLSKESKNSVIAVEASKALTYQIVYSLLIKIQDAGFYNVSLTGFY